MEGASAALITAPEIAASTVYCPRIPITTKFHEGKQYTLAVSQNKDRIRIVIPTIFAPSAKQKSFGIDFSTKKNFQHPGFGKFVADELKAVVTDWQLQAQARTWCTSICVWRNYVAAKWLRDHKSVNGDESEPVFMVQIPPRFSKSAACSTIYIRNLTVKRKRETASRRRDGFMIIPESLVKVKNRKRVKVGQLSADWLTFLGERLQYVVDRWTTVEDARKWCQRFPGRFVKLARVYFDDMRSKRECKFWEIKKSTIPVDQMYIKKEYFPKDAKPGSGLFCTKTGEHKIYFGGQLLGITERILRSATVRVTKVQGCYQVQVDNKDPNPVDVPTTESTECGVVHHGFIVNHRENNPTHSLTIEKRKRIACLVPIRVTKVGEEFCFNYRYELSRDVPTTE